MLFTFNFMERNMKLGKKLTKLYTLKVFDLILFTILEVNTYVRVVIHWLNFFRLILK